MKDCLVLIFNILSAVTAHAQEITGNIEGHIVNSSGKPIPEVNISLLSKNLQGIRGT